MNFPRILMGVIFCFLFSITNPLLAAEYVVGSSDLLTIDVFKEKEFSGDFRIDIKGSLNYPPVGDVPVGGKNVEEIKVLLSNILSKDYLVNPKVTVSVKEYNSKKVMVLGAVAKPGIYFLKEQTRVLDIISMAGGITKEGSQRLVVLRKESSPKNEAIDVKDVNRVDKNDSKERGKEQIAIEEKISEKPKLTDELIKTEVQKEDTKQEEPAKEVEVTSGLGEKKVQEEEISDVYGKTKDSAKDSGLPSSQPTNLKPLMIDYGKILKGGDLSQNIEILGGDIINVPNANEIFVFGSIKSPGPIKYEENMGILQAVTRAGGPTPEAAPGSTYILRMETGGKEEKIKVNLSKVLKQKAENVDVKPNDVIVVPEGFF